MCGDGTPFGKVPEADSLCYIDRSAEERLRSW
jgi:hypothetical protein